MNGSPLNSWEGVEAYFTFADKPAVIAFSLILAVLVTVAVIVKTFSHEKHSYAQSAKKAKELGLI